MPGEIHRMLTHEELRDGQCMCRATRTYSMFLYGIAMIPFCDECKRQIVPDDRTVLYKSHGSYHEGWGFVAITHTAAERAERIIRH